MNIAVCDDERVEITKIQNAIAETQGDYRVDTFRSCKMLLEAVAQGEKYDIAFFDIYMNDENGMDAAKELLTLSSDTAIVFITSSTEHAVEAFSIQALHYIVKPIQSDDIIEVFRRFGMKRDPRHTLTVRKIGRAHV